MPVVSFDATVPPIPDLNLIIHPSLNSIMIGHTFTTLLLPLLIALFYFSTPQSRQRPIFILNVIVIIFAFAAGVMVDVLAIHTVLSPLSPWPPSLNIAIGIVGAFQSIIVDLILLVRLMSVHPLRHVGLRRFVMLTSLPILLKIARVVNIIIFTVVLADAARGPLGPQKIAIEWATTPYLKIEWSAQMVDNAYASLAFLWTIRDRGNRRGVTSNIHPNKVTFTQRLRILSRIALSNFIIPSLFSIAQLIVVYRNVNVVVVNDIVLANVMLAVFGVVFATVWSGNQSRREAQLASWGDASRTVDGAQKQHLHRFSFPGLGTWRVGTSPPTMTFGSTAPTKTSGLIERDEIVLEKRSSQSFVATDPREVNMRKGDIMDSSGLSTPTL